jgi:predicted transposase/invertase (TIGR01784 family)
MTDHDSSYKYLFSHPAMVRDLITGFIPDEWLHGLDYDTLEQLPSEYISDDFRRRSDDLIWRVKVGGQWVYLYFLIEFQSSVDRYMALRVMVYLGLLYQDLIRQGDVLVDGRLPPVLPIVLYNGDARWTAPVDIAELIPPVPGLVGHFKPQLKYFLIDEHIHKDTELASQKNLVAAIFRFEQGTPFDEIPDLIDLLRDWLADQPELRKMFARWIRATLRRKDKSSKLLTDIVQAQIDDLQELRVMLADNIERWMEEKEAMFLQRGIEKGMQQGREKWMQQGMQQGEALALQRLLIHRFGSVPAEIRTRITNATQKQLEVWLDAVIDAPSLEAIFKPQNQTPS